MGDLRSDPVLALETCDRRLRAGGLGQLIGRKTQGRISWYGPAGFTPGRPGSEATVQAIAGLMEVHGRDRDTPRRLGLEVASVAAGLLAAQGRMAAAIAGLRGRPISDMHISVLQAGLLLLSHPFAVATDLGDAVPGPPLPAPGPPFRSAEGRWFEIETLDAGPWRAFWTRLGAGDTELGHSWTQFRWRYERASCSLPGGLHEATAGHRLADLRAIATEVGVSLTPLRDYADVLTDPGTNAAHPSVSAVDGEPMLATGGAAICGGGLPLVGIRVVEATSRIQGPFAGMLLRMLGAAITRVQPPEGDFGRAASTLHRDKSTVRLDLGRPADRASLVGLVGDADVFLHNWRPGKAAEWGLTGDDLRRRRTGLIYASTSGWGDRAEAHHLVGTDFLIQAFAGLGNGLHPPDEPAFPSRFILADLFGGIVTAEGILAALYRRERSGHICEVRSSLLAGAMSIQAHVLDSMAAGTEKGRRDGRPMWTTLDRPIPTTAGHLMVSVDDDESLALLCRLCRVDPTGGTRGETERAVVDHLGQGVAAEWEQALADAGIAAAVVCADLADVPADPRMTHLFEPVGTTGLVPRSPWTFS